MNAQAMNQETQIPNDAEISNNALDATESEVVDPEVTDGTSQKPAEPAKTPEQIEVERLRRALTKRDRTQGKMYGELEQLRSQLAQRQPVQQQTESVQDNPPADRQAIEREAMTLAERIADTYAEAREFHVKTESVVTAGNKEFKDFPDALKALIDEAGALVTPTGQYTPSGIQIVRPTVLGEQILDSDAPAALIHFLGKNPELAAELDGLTPARMGRKLAAIEQQMAAKPKTSAAPKPLDPVKGVGVSDDYSPNMSDAAYKKWRDRQKAKP